MQHKEKLSLEHIENLKKEIEHALSWGDSTLWNQKDFNELSERIYTKTGVQLSVMTLKRIWGRVQYSSSPSLVTLDALARFVGSESWRAFVAQHVSEIENSEKSLPADGRLETQTRQPQKKQRFWQKPYAIHLVLSLTLISFAVWFWGSTPYRSTVSNKEAFQFSSKLTGSSGVPNSVVFTIDGRAATEDSLVLQQSWDERRNVKIAKDQRHHTAIYYYPGHFTAKLIDAGKVVKSNSLLIQTNGWISMIDQFPVPIYLKPEAIFRNGKMEVSGKDVIARTSAPIDAKTSVSFYRTQDFGPIYSDEFSFETSVRNTYGEGAGVCQKATVLLQCIDQMIWIPLSDSGCIADLNLGFTKFALSGKTADLSRFGVDFSRYVKLNIESSGGKGKIFINDRLVQVVDRSIARTKIVGIGFKFQGAGSVDYVRLSNDQHSFQDYF